MKVLHAKSFIFTIAAALCFVLVATTRAYGETWTQIRTNNFTLIGDSDERDMRRAALHLEGLREIFVRLLAPQSAASIPAPVVFAFRDDASHTPFKPLDGDRPAADVAGYFQPGADTDYIAFHFAQGSGRNALEILAHEYVHLLARHSFRGAPLWFTEGIAEYYSTLELAGANRFIIGKPVEGRLLTLRDKPLLPLTALLETDQTSPAYIEKEKRSVFYAQSWALVHYLLSGGREAQLARYLELTRSDVSPRDAFLRAFGADAVALEQALSAYVRRGNLKQQIVALDVRLPSAASLRSAAMTRAEAFASLGDLLSHVDREEAAEDYLQRALALNPDLAATRISLGRLRLRQNRLDEARLHLERAVALADRNHLAHYLYADVLSRDGGDAAVTVRGYTERTILIRAELRRTLELAPDFLPAHRLLAETEITRGTELNLAAEYLKRALTLAPDRAEFVLLLARLHMRREEHAAAREALNKLKTMIRTSFLREEAQRLSEELTKREGEIARRASSEDNTLPEFAWRPQTLPCDMPQPGPFLKKLRFDGEQACGRLIAIECEDAGVMLTIETDKSTLKLRNAKLSRVRFITYTTDARGNFQCGVQNPAPTVLVTYRSGKSVPPGADGEAVAVEFVPAEWSETGNDE